MTDRDAAPGTASVQCVGVVVHPSRNIDPPLDQLRGWADAHDVTVVQVAVPGQDRMVADRGDVGDCDLIVSIGGDGTMLAAIRAAEALRLPVLGVSCGSLGVLTAVPAGAVATALDRVRRNDWSPRVLPALSVTRPGAPALPAFNDACVVRNGIGQVRVASTVDGVLFARLAGDGCIVSTPLGSTAYALAAGGPLLAPGTDAYLLTPLPSHGGSRQPLVIPAGAELALEISTGIGGARLEIDGQVLDQDPGTLRITLRQNVATLVGFPDQEPLFTSLRRRGIIADSPRIVADAVRATADPVAKTPPAGV
ncbi:MAG TPA: NAD(+)/NADH kinase [Solirubrobacteraceae bacterium]|nr:NAD(+)/NADH kinase [Solirubrobacteraceae bacterium]